MTSAQARLGGPVGRHGRAVGLWRDPGPWVVLAATLVWLATLWRQHPCQQVDPGNEVNSMMRLCYSDAPVLFRGTSFGTGATPYLDVPLDQAWGTGALLWLGRSISLLFHAPLDVESSGASVLAASNVFFQVNAVLLFCCFLVMVGCHLLMGRDSARSLPDGVRGRTRSWDAMLVACAPAVFTAGLVNWDLFAACLVAAALLAWASHRQVSAGVLVALAVSARAYALLVLLAWLLGCLRTRAHREWTITALAAAVTWTVVNLPLLVMAPKAWATWLTSWAGRGADLGSIWLVLEKVGITVPALNLVVALCFLAALAGIVVMVLRAPRRPRTAQVLLLLVLALCVVNKVWSPQQVLWLFGLVALARPRLLDFGIWSLAHALYWWAVWGHLGGQLASGSGSGDVVYVAAIALRLGIDCWLASQVIVDIHRPWEDPVRAGHVDDPIGGVLDHAPDRA